MSAETGKRFPDFSLQNQDGKTVTLDDFKGKWLVLYVYPKDDTPGCTTQACGFRDSYQKIEVNNAVVLGVSPDDVDSHQAFKTKFDLPFPLLVDQDHSISEAYGTWQERERDGRKFMGIARSHFVIDEHGKVVDVQYNVPPAESPERAMGLLGK